MILLLLLLLLLIPATESEALRQTEAEEKRRAVREFQQRRSADLAQARRLQEEERQRQVAEVAAMIEENRVRVEERERLWEMKELEKRERQHRAALIEERRLEICMRLAAQVPYYDEILNAKSKLEHLTSSALSHQYNGHGRPSDQRGHIPSYGFADKSIIRDARFRLAEALRYAGVHHSEAAKAAVRSNMPRPHLQIHGLL